MSITVPSTGLLKISWNEMQIKLCEEETNVSFIHNKLMQKAYWLSECYIWTWCYQMEIHYRKYTMQIRVANVAWKL